MPLARLAPAPELLDSRFFAGGEAAEAHDGFEDGPEPSPDVASRTRHEYRWRSPRLGLVRHQRSPGRASDARSAFSSLDQEVSNPP